MGKKLKIQMNGRSDEYQTPEIAIEYIIPYLNKKWIIWESAWGGGMLATHLKKRGFNVIKIGKVLYDIELTNPPYSDKVGFLERAYERGKPFAFLLPLTTLEGKKRGELFKKYGIQLIIPNKRINFVTPDGKNNGAWFQTAWFCWKLNLPKELNFVEIIK